ncbi:MAG: hypothetical protein RQ826_02750 [Xanthomonadales bacterium]|nr:hypothetical protein [Xanthomonadales bacterium]
MDQANSSQNQKRRHRAIKTAWALAVVAALIFIAFILSGVLRA